MSAKQRKIEIITKYKTFVIEVDKKSELPKLKVRKRTWITNNRLLNIKPEDLSVLSENELAALKLKLYKFVSNLGKKNE